MRSNEYLSKKSIVVSGKFRLFEDLNLTRLQSSRLNVSEVFRLLTESSTREGLRTMKAPAKKPAAKKPAAKAPAKKAPAKKKK